MSENDPIRLYHDPVYLYSQDVVSPALNVVSIHKPQSIAFEVTLLPNAMALKRTPDIELRAAYSDPLQTETNWVTVKPLDKIAKAVLATIDKDRVGEDSVGDVIREICLRLHNGSAYNATCAGNALTSPNKPVIVTLTRSTAQPSPSAN